MIRSKSATPSQVQVDYQPNWSVIHVMKERPFVCSVADCTFIIRFNEDHELHVFTCKSDSKLNWTEKHPKGTSELITSLIGA